MEYKQKNPDEIIEEALNGKNIVRESLSDYFTWLQDVKGKSYNSSIQGSYSIIRGFYSHNDINTQKIRSPKSKPSEVQFSDDNIPLMEIIEVDGKKQKITKRDLIRDFLNELSFRDRTITLCQLSSGLDSADLLNLPLSLIRYQDQDRFFIRNLRSKTQETFSVFFSREASKMLRKYERLRRREASDTDFIFVNRNNGKIASRDLSDNLRLSAIRLFKQLPKQSPLRPKRFRKLFSDVCDDAGLPVDIKRVFMGKSDPANKTYEGQSRLDLELYYERIEPNLTIFSEPFDNSSENKKLRTELDILKLKVERMETSHEKTF